MVSGINNIQQSSFQPQFSQQGQKLTSTNESITSFDNEDQAIISSQAKLLNELDKFNNGGDNIVNLAVANVMAKITTEAEVNVINTKIKMIDDVLNMENNS